MTQENRAIAPAKQPIVEGASIPRDCTIIGPGTCLLWRLNRTVYTGGGPQVISGLLPLGGESVALPVYLGGSDGIAALIYSPRRERRILDGVTSGRGNVGKGVFIFRYKKKNSGVPGERKGGKPDVNSSVYKTTF